MFKLEQFKMIGDEIFLKHHFEFPVTWVMVGVNGALFAGRSELSIQKEVRTIILTGKAKKLRFPVNMMLVDRTGKAAHVLFKKPDAPIDLTGLQIGQA